MILRILSFLIPCVAFAEFSMNEVVVSSRSNVTSDNFTSSHIVLDQKKLDSSTEVLGALRKLPGIFIDQTGGPGSQAAIRIRGSEVRHVLVLIDGVKVFDPSNTDRHFNAAFLNLTDVKKIEILKGAQSHLYGADAIGGVINIITHKKIGENVQQVSGSWGANNMIESTLTTSSDEFGTVYLNAFLQQSELISAAAGGQEKDEMLNKGLTVNWGHGIGANWWTSFMVKNQQSDNDTDAGSFIDDENAKVFNQQQIYSWSLEYDKQDHKFKGQIALNRHDRENTSDYGRYPFFGQNISWEGNYSYQTGRQTFALGMRLEQEQISTKDIDFESVDMSGIHGQYFYHSEHLFANAGFRGDFHQTFGSIGNVGVGVGRHWGKNWTLKSQYATGYKAPSLYQLYAQDLGAPFNCKVGNDSLAPEKSKSIDVGLIRRWDKLELETTLFYNDIYDYIDYQCDIGYQNVTNYHSQGLEVAINREFSPDLQLGVSLIAAKFERDSNLEVPRRPDFQTQFILDYKISDELSFSLQHRYVGKRFDYVLGDEYRLGEYHLTDLNIDLKKQKSSWSWQLMLQNLFDHKYQEVAGYNRPGFNATLRFKTIF